MLNWRQIVCNLQVYLTFFIFGLLLLGGYWTLSARLTVVEQRSVYNTGRVDKLEAAHFVPGKDVPTQQEMDKLRELMEQLTNLQLRAIERAEKIDQKISRNTDRIMKQANEIQKK